MRMMSRAGFGLAGLALAAPAGAAPLGSPLGGDAAACVAGNQPAILASLQGFKDRTGRVKLELYPDSATDFLRPDGELIAAGKPFRRVWADLPASGPVSICLRAPGPGRYGVIVTHQREGQTRFNFRVDGVALPQATPIGRAKPRIDQARLTVGAGVVPVTMTLQYLRGLSGFGPVRG